MMNNYKSSENTLDAFGSEKRCYKIKWKKDRIQLKNKQNHNHMNGNKINIKTDNQIGSKHSPECCLQAARCDQS